MKHIVILGNGISGITAARHIRKNSDHRITVISTETDHFFSRTALMYIYMGHMKYEHTKPYEDFFWEKNRIELVRAWVERFDFEDKTLILDSGINIKYDTLVLGVGSVPNKIGWPGEDLEGVQGLYSYQDLEAMEANTHEIEEAVVVGGGLIGIEMAEMLRTRDINVTMLVREEEYWNGVLPDAEAKMIGRHIREHGVNLRLSTELEEILPDGDSKQVRAVTTKGGEEIPCRFVGLAVGVKPNIAQFEDTPLEIDKGILVNEFLETNLPDVYAIGDCVQHRQPLPDRKPVEQIWYTGRIMGETIARTICQERTAYQPGMFFNSAKFFDIEYQTYGQVPAQTPDDTDTFYWEHPSGRIALRLNYDKESEALTGVNAFGLRLRHEVCDTWIRGKKSIGYVLSHLKDAHFDPEIFARHEPAIVEAFNEKHPDYLIRYVGKPTFWERLFA
ncbi:MAG: FAD-dependent oxidoreductase [Bacteroidetes bacterium]|nr:FAD-dependent oxidoreductase [Bacteroidota bacterium]